VQPFKVQMGRNRHKNKHRGGEQRVQDSPRRVHSPLLEREEDARVMSIPFITPSSNVDQVWVYVEYALKEQSADHRIVGDIKGFIFDQRINGRTLLGLSMEEMEKGGLDQLGSRKELLSVVEQAKAAQEEEEIKAADIHDNQ
jgi:hypothetical protein